MPSFHECRSLTVSFIKSLSNSKLTYIKAVWTALSNLPKIYKFSLQKEMPTIQQFIMTQTCYLMFMI